MLFFHLKEAGYKVSANIQGMLLLMKLPSSMDVVAQMIVQAKDMASKLVDPTITGIYKAAVLSWDQHHMTGKGKQPAQANKNSAVKPKRKDLPFSHSSSNPLTSLHRQVMLMLLERGSKSIKAKKGQICKTMLISPPPPMFLSLYLPLRPPPLLPSMCALLHINPCHSTKGTKDCLLILKFSRCFLLLKGLRFTLPVRQFGHLMQPSPPPPPPLIPSLFAPLFIRQRVPIPIPSIMIES